MTANGNKTVVITTHYIEEARQAHTVSNNYCIKKYILFKLICDMYTNTNIILEHFCKLI